MADVGIKAERAANYHANGVFRARVGTTDRIYKMVQSFSITLDQTNQDEDYLDDGSAMFSRVGDKIGTFNFDLKKTVSLFETSSTPSSQWLASYWLDNLAKDEPPEIDFVETIYAGKTTGNKFARIRIKGRIRGVTSRRDAGKGVGDIIVAGEVIAFSSAIRAAT